MIRSLRKGRTTIEPCYKYGSESISAIDTEIELMSDHAVVRTKLKPVDGNQRDDADHVFNNVDSLTQIIFQDQQVRDKTSTYLNAYDQIKYLGLEIDYKKIHKFPVALKLKDNDGLLFTIKA